MTDLQSYPFFPKRFYNPSVIYVLFCQYVMYQSPAYMYATVTTALLEIQELLKFQKVKSFVNHYIPSVTKQECRTYFFSMVPIGVGFCVGARAIYGQCLSENRFSPNVHGYNIGSDSRADSVLVIFNPFTRHRGLRLLNSCWCDNFLYEYVLNQ